MHVWPAPPVNTPWVLTPAAALSRSASAKTMFGDFPPSSNASCFNVPALRCWMIRPVSLEPVKVMRPTPGCWTSASPASSPSPATTFTTPGGKPASTNSAHAASTEHDACSAGLSTTQLPAVSAAATFAENNDSGEFHGMITPITPMGSRRVKLKLVEPTVTVSPVSLSAMPAW